MADLAVTPEVLEFLLLDEQARPGHLREEIWDELGQDPELQAVVHGALVYISRNHPGTSSEAIAQSEGFREGIAYALQGIRQSMEAQRVDEEVLASLEA